MLSQGIHDLSVLCWFTFVMVTSRLFNSQLNLQKHFLSIYYPSRGSCHRDPPSMIAYTSCRPLLRPLTVWSPNFDLNHLCVHYVWFYGFSCLITFPYICIYSYFKFCCFASMCNTSIIIICLCSTIYNTRSYLYWYANIAKCKNVLNMGYIYAYHKNNIFQKKLPW